MYGGVRCDMDVVYGTSHLHGSFGGVSNLQRYIGRLLCDVKKFFASQDAYTLHKPRRIRFPRRKTYPKGIGDLFQIDLVNMTSLSSFNDGMRYLLTCIDVFTKRAWAVPVRKKSVETSPSISERFWQIKPNMMRTDKGSEFLNSSFQSTLQHHSIKFYTSENEDLKAAVGTI